jgi:hypothetical protein
MVNRLWCETAIPLLWRNPWHNIYYCANKDPLYSIITSYLSDDIKEFLTREGIHNLGQSLAFDYLSFCRSINVKIIDDIISIGSSSEYNRFLLQEEIYGLLIRKCPEIRWLNICGGTYQIVYIPEAKTHLESLCELTCDTSIKPNYFYGLARVCQYVERIIIISNTLKVNYGAVKLIEVQKNLKYFEWKDGFDEDDDYFSLDYPFTEIFHVLKKHANTLDHIDINILYEYGYNDFDYILRTLLELYKLKILNLNSLIFLHHKEFEEKLEMVAYRDLEIFEISVIDIYYATCIIKNSRYLRKLKINDYYEDCDDKFYDKTLNLIRTICENCHSVEYLSIPVFPFSDDHLIEFEKLLKKCQNLRSLVFINTSYGKTVEVEDGEHLSNVLIRAASKNLREIIFNYEIRFTSKTLETFFEKWRGRPAISISVSAAYCQSDEFINLVNKYIVEGIIKEFRF